MLRDRRIRGREMVGRTPHTGARGDWSSGMVSQQEEVKMCFLQKKIKSHLVPHLTSSSFLKG